jgi:beta-lactamase superfamily II metal-dependent hydrolase
LLKLVIIQAEYGDCLMLQSSDGGNSTSVLIDGGPSQTYEKNLKPTLDMIVTSKKLDLVILSHIDNDHVLGLLDLFEAIKKDKESGGSEVLKVSGLWHNTFSNLIRSNNGANKLMRNIFSSNQFFGVGNNSKIDELPVLSALKGISEGRDLTNLAQTLNIPINSQFGGDLIVTKKGDAVVKLQNLKFYILGPTQKNLEKLRKIWDSWVKSHAQVGDTPKDYEALKILDASITNLSSLMFMVESEGKKLLFTGDGLGRDILDLLSEKQMLNSEGRLHVNILKVPHHGSERNISEQFFDTITADVYIISANGRDDNPSFLTLTWIIETAKKYHRKVTIVATNKTENIKKAQQIYDSKKFQFNFVFLEPNANFLKLDAKGSFVIR